MKKAICTTTIFSPSYALRKFVKIAKRDGWVVIIAGDLKTPHEEYIRLEDESDGHVVYLSPEDQERMSKDLSDTIGWNCIQRRNFAYIEAYNRGAQIIATVDDDNIPDDSWGVSVHVGQEMEVDTFTNDLPVFDPLSVTNHPEMWHRGFPPQYIPEKNNIRKAGVSKLKIHVQADMWDGAPDIDAICRAQYPEDVELRGVNGDLFFTSDKPMPFNSQNTFLSREAMRYYFLFPHIGRMDDIWAAYYLQEVLGQCVVFKSPSVYQKRNEHDISKDFAAELIGYKHSKDVIDDGVLEYLPEGSVKAYEQYKSCLI